MNCFIFGSRAIALAVLFSLTGCTTLIADAMVGMPHRGRVFDESRAPDAAALALLGVDHVLYVPVGPPDATMAAWVFEPADRDDPRGTILLLHGYHAGPVWMVGKARDLSKHGYRAVVVALRGYGSSTGDFHTFGVSEREDLSKVIDALEARGLASDYLGVMGISYGGAAAIQLAGADPRIDAVVAQSAFSSLRDVAPPFGRSVVPVPGLLMSDAQYDAVVDEAGRIASFDPDEADTVAAIGRTSAPVLLVHGDWDMVIPAAQSRALLAAAGSDAALMRVPAAGHLTVALDADGKIGRATVAWFNRWQR